MPAKRHKNNKKKQPKQRQPQERVTTISDENAASDVAAFGGHGTEGGLEDVESANAKLPYRIESSSIVGRYIVASRDLQAGELIIAEEPLAIGPCISAQAVCLGCYVPVQLTLAQYRCADCKWPLCGPRCRGLRQLTGHSAHECELFKAQNTAAPLNAVNATPTAVKSLYELVLIARILLLSTHAPATYARILRMESHTEMRRQNAALWQHYEDNVVARLRRQWQLDQFTAAEIHTVCGILDVNCFEIGQLSAKARSLYPSAFLLAHDCSPNTSHTDHPQTYAIIVRASRAVRQDEALTLSYAYTLQGTLKRRDFMYAGKLFWCSCQRCADPFELGSDCSALRCAECSEGSIRATDPLDQTAKWRCDTCEFQLSASDVTKILDRVNRDLDAIDVHDVPGLESFLRRYSAVLRPNHYLLLSAKYSLCQVYGRTEGYLIHTMSSEDIERKERYCREFLAAIDKLEPGLTRLRGLIMYELHAPIMVLSQRLLQSNQLSREDFRHRIAEVRRLLRESRDILKMEPAASNEYQMGLAAEDALRRMGDS